MLQHGAILLNFPVLICRRIGLAYELTPKTVLVNYDMRNATVSGEIMR